MRLRNIPGADDAILNSEYCIKNPEEQKGHWQDCFDKVQPLHIEIGMGKGRFIMDTAALHPDINYIGIERYSSVLLRALQKVEQNPLPNIKFICMDAADVAEVFAKDEVDRIYLNFSDPWPKDRHELHIIIFQEDNLTQELRTAGNLDDSLNQALTCTIVRVSLASEKELYRIVRVIHDLGQTIEVGEQ